MTDVGTIESPGQKVESIRGARDAWIARPTPARIHARLSAGRVTGTSVSSAHRHDVGIRPYGPGDFPLLERLLGDPVTTLHIGGPESSAALIARHERYLGHDGSTGGLFTVVLAPESSAVGWVGYWESSWQGETVWECGWHVLPEHQGRGVAAAATALMLDQARARGLYRHMHAFPSVDNVASNALCRRLGFELLGAADVEYPKGCLMHANNWRLDLGPGCGRLTRRAGGRIGVKAKERGTASG